MLGQTAQAGRERAEPSPRQEEAQQQHRFFIPYRDTERTLGGTRALIAHEASSFETDRF